MEYAKHMADMIDASHAEIDRAGLPVFVPLTCSLFGEYREMRTVPGTKAATICGTGPMAGYHFCSYCLAAEVVPLLEAEGLSGW